MMTAGRAGHGQLRPSWAPDPALAAVFLAISLPAVLAVAETFTRTSSSMLDLRVYLWGGAFVDHGQNPYTHIFRHFLYFTYTPFAAAVFALLVPLNLMVTRWLITAASVASLIAVVWLTWGSLGYARTQARVGWTLGAAAVVLWIEHFRQSLVERRRRRRRGGLQADTADLHPVSDPHAPVPGRRSSRGNLCCHRSWVGSADAQGNT
jgi:lysylphosphatidylglycerol synthetase-like protein (DUF2156 family)